MSKANKEEIARLVVSSLQKLRLQQPVTAPEQFLSHLAHAKPGRSKHANKPARRRRKPSRSTREDRTKHRTSEIADHYECSFPLASQQKTTTPDVFYRPQESNIHGDEEEQTTTVIRQRVEKQVECAEVSLDGLWLPSLPSPGNFSGAERVRTSGDNSTRWAEPINLKASSASVMPSSKAGRGKLGLRPSTVASQVPFSSKAYPSESSTTGAVRAGRSGAVTAGGALMRQGMPRVEGDGREIPLKNRGDARGSEGSDATPPISQDTAVMLARSRALVARAKVRKAHKNCPLYNQVYLYRYSTSKVCEHRRIRTSIFFQVKSCDPEKFGPEEDFTNGLYGCQSHYGTALKQPQWG